MKKAMLALSLIAAASSRSEASADDVSFARYHDRDANRPCIVLRNWSPTNGFFFQLDPFKEPNWHDGDAADSNNVRILKIDRIEPDSNNPLFFGLLCRKRAASGAWDPWDGNEYRMICSQENNGIPSFELFPVDDSFLRRTGSTDWPVRGDVSLQGTNLACRLWSEGEFPCLIELEGKAPTFGLPFSGSLEMERPNSSVLSSVSIRIRPPTLKSPSTQRFFALLPARSVADKGPPVALRFSIPISSPPLDEPLLLKSGQLSALLRIVPLTSATLKSGLSMESVWKNVVLVPRKDGENEQNGVERMGADSAGDTPERGMNTMGPCPANNGKGDSTP